MKITSTQLFSGLCLILLTPIVVNAQYLPNQFTNTVPIPYLVEGSLSGGVTTYDLNFAGKVHNFDPNGATNSYLPTVPGDTFLYNINAAVGTWGINSSTRKPSSAPDMTYLGPTILWKHGDTVQMNVTNNLPDTTPGNGQMTTSHWHGLNVPAYGDGGPHQAIPNKPSSKNTWKPKFPMVDPAQTIWYHSHVMMYTTEQVIMGLAGMIIVEDHTTPAAIALNKALPHDYGSNDFPLVIQEKEFLYDTTHSGSIDSMKATALNVSEKPGNGEFRVVNGVALGQLKVPNSVVRFRVLNGDARKSFNIGFSTNIDPANVSGRLDFYQVATDGGYMGKPHKINSFLVNPGERGEFIIDFGQAGLAGVSEVFLSNRVADPEVATAKDIVGIGAGKVQPGYITPGYAFMKFVIDSTIKPANPITKIADSNLFPKYQLDSCPTPNKRTKNLNHPGGKTKQWLIDSLPMDMGRLDDTIRVNTCEEWTVINNTPIAHPFHIHKVQFQIKQYIDGSSGTPDTMNYPNLPTYMLGYKDVMIVRKGSQFTFQARFDHFGDSSVDTSNGYMYHCHILTHEDFSMMHQFTVVNDSVWNSLYPSSIEDRGEQQSFSLYPNPAGDVLYLRGNSRQDGSLRITDLMGRTLQEVKVKAFSTETRIDVETFHTGMVIVEYTSGDQRMTQKILLE